MSTLSRGISERLSCRSLVDSDASSLMLLGLGHRDAEDAVLEVGGDTLLLHACREAEAARELSNAALREPVLGLINWLLLVGRLILRLADSGDLLLGLASGLVFDSRLVGVAALLAALSNGATHGVVFKMARGRRPGSVSALDAPADDHGLRFRELDVDMLLHHAWELAMELVGVGGLPDVKLGLPGRDAGSSSLSLALAAGVGIKVVKETEERSEGGVGVVVVVVVEVAWEESHGARLSLAVKSVEWCCSLNGSRDLQREFDDLQKVLIFLGVNLRLFFCCCAFVLCLLCWL